ALAYALVATSSPSWLSVTPAGGSTGGSFTVSANPASLAAGSYTGTVKVYSAVSNSPVSLPVTFNVGSATFTLIANPTSLAFSSVTGVTTPSKTLAVTTSSSSSVSYTAAASTSGGGNWLSVSPTSGTTGGSALTVSVNPSVVPSGGTYTGTI